MKDWRARAMVGVVLAVCLASILGRHWRSVHAGACEDLEDRAIGARWPTLSAVATPSAACVFPLDRDTAAACEIVAACRQDASAKAAER